MSASCQTSDMTHSSVRPNTSNIVRVYRQATADQLARGMSWYAETHSLALALDKRNIRRSAGVIAALSPRIRWEGNARLAIRTYAEDVASGTLTQSCKAAQKIYDGADTFDILKAPKVRSFAACIIDPTDAHAVVIDRHAFDVAVGRATDDDTRKILGRKGEYERWARAYRRAARIIGVTPSQVQAVTWIVWRER